jgi:hypothetical protein
MPTSYKVTLRDTTFPSGIKSNLVAYVDTDDTLVLDGYDIGETVESIWGDSDYEYWVKVKSQDKNKVLLELIKDRFTSETDFQKWLESKNIPSTFSSWV